MEQIYDVPLGISSWNDVAISLQSDFKAVLGVFYLSPYHPQSELASSVSSMWEIFEQHYCKDNDEQAALTKNNWIINTSSENEFFLSSRKFNKAEPFEDYWTKDNFCHTMGTIVSTSKGISLQLGFPRNKNLGDFSKEEISRMQFYARGIRRALELEGVLGSSLPPAIYEHALVSTHGFSGAEARMVIELFKCGSLPDTAKELNRSYHTVRNQMKSVLVKTGTTNQLMLMQFLMSIKPISNSETLN